VCWLPGEAIGKLLRTLFDGAITIECASLVQVASKYDVETVQNYFSFKLGSAHFELEAVATDVYDNFVKQPGMIMTRSVQDHVSD